MLVNNAGMGGICPFAETDLRYIDERILLNVRASVVLTRLYLPVLMRQSNAFILFTGSLAGFYPIPFKSLYSSSKAFLLTFSRSIRYELKGSGVKVSILLPQCVRTMSQLQNGSIKHFGIQSVHGIDRRRCCQDGYEGMLKGKAVIVPGLMTGCFLFSGCFTGPVQRACSRVSSGRN
jgi:short-subunit dehydrogenase